MPDRLRQVIEGGGACEPLSLPKIKDNKQDSKADPKTCLMDNLKVSQRQT